jgi:hypothetical protein
VGTTINGGAATVQVQLRVLDPLGATVAFLRSGGIESVPAAGEHQFSTSIPIGVGDRIAVNVLTASHAVQALSLPGYTLEYWENPVPADGTSDSPDNLFPGQLAELFADVEPTNTLPEPSLKRNKKKGTAQLTVDLPNPGELRVGPAGAFSGLASIAAKSGLIKPLTTPATAPGLATLTLRPTKATKRRLREKGKAKGSVTLSYTPSFGVTATRAVKVKLKRKS